MTSRYPALDRFLLFMDQDMFIIWEDMWTAVEDLVDGNREDMVPVPREIRGFLSEYDNEPAVVDYVGSLASYLPTTDGWDSYRQWLAAVAERIDQLLTAE